MRIDTENPTTSQKSRGTPARSTLVVALAVAVVCLALAPIAQATATIFGPFPRITTTYGVGTVTIVPPTTNSPGLWSYVSSNPRVATVNGGVLIILLTGTSTITATQAASGAFTERSRSALLVVNPGTPTVGVFASQSVSITQGSLMLSPPTSTSNGSWTYTSSKPLIASVSGNVVTFLDGGVVEITATQSNTTLFTGATAKMTLTVVALVPVLGTFGNITLMKDSVGSVTLIAPTSTGPGAWTFMSSNPAVASINGATLTPVGLGTAIITATQAHSGNYGSATVSMTTTIQAALPTIGAFPNLTAAYASSGANTVIIKAPTSNSSGGWTLTSSDPTVASIPATAVAAGASATATLHKPGATLITATQAGVGNYGSSTPVAMTLTVVGTPTIGAWANIEKVIKDSDFTLTPPSTNSPNAWTYTSADTNVVEIVSGVVKVKGAGQTTITATQASSSTWAQGAATLTIRVLGDIPTIGAFAAMTATVGQTPLEIKAPTTNSLGTWTYTSSDPKVATVSAGTLVIVGAGTATISAMQLPLGNYSQSNTVQTTLTVKAGAVVPTPTPSASASPKPSASPTVTAKPTPSATVKPIPAPTVKPIAKPVVTVTVVQRVITISVTKAAAGSKVTATINKVAAKIGKNTVKPGIKTVVVKIAGKVVYTRGLTIK